VRVANAVRGFDAQPDDDRDHATGLCMCGQIVVNEATPDDSNRL